MSVPLMQDQAARTGRPRDPQADEAILSTALRLLVQDGYARLTMNAVAARDGVGKASLYRRWPTKERLVSCATKCSAHSSCSTPSTELNDLGDIGAG